MHNQFTYGCSATPCQSTGRISLAESFGGLAGDIDVRGQAIDRFTALVVDTRDQHIRSALVALGWTPPPDPGAATRPAGDAAGDACLAKAESAAAFDSKGAADFMLRYLDTHGVASSESLVDAAKLAGFRPHDDRAFGPVIAGLARRGEMFVAGGCLRRRGNGTAGGRLWRRSATNGVAHA